MVAAIGGPERTGLYHVGLATRDAVRQKVQGDKRLFFCRDRGGGYGLIISEYGGTMK